MAPPPSNPRFDLIIRRAKVVDGTGIPAYVADVGIEGDRITKIGRIEEEAVRVIDAEGLLLAPHPPVHGQESGVVVVTTEPIEFSSHKRKGVSKMV